MFCVYRVNNVIIIHQNWGATQQFVYKTSLKFRHLVRDIRSSSDNDGLTSDTLIERIKKKLGGLLQLSEDVVDLNIPMTHYGVDSLVAMELITWANREFNLHVTQVEVLNGMTAASLVKRATQGLR